MCWSEDDDAKVSNKFTCSKCEGNIREAVEQEVKSCNEVQTVRVYISG